MGQNVGQCNASGSRQLGECTLVLHVFASILQHTSADFDALQHEFSVLLELVRGPLERRRLSMMQCGEDNFTIRLEGERMAERRWERGSRERMGAREWE